MRNIKIYSGLGSMIEVGTVRIQPGGPMVIQEDQLTPQAMQQYGDYIATASMDNVIEYIGIHVNVAFLRNSFGWVEAEEARQRSIKEEVKDEGLEILRKAADIAKESLAKENAGGEGDVPESPESPADDKGAEAPAEDSVPSTEEPPKEEEPSEGSPTDKPAEVKSEYDPFDEEKPKKATKKASKKKKAARKKKK